MNLFWAGFEKQASSLLGEMPGLRSGVRTFKSKGVIKAPKPPTPNLSTVGRAAPQPLPGPRYQPGDSKTMMPIVKKMPQPHIPKRMPRDPLRES